MTIYKWYTLEEIRELATTLTKEIGRDLAEPVQSKGYSSVPAEIEVEVEFGIGAAKSQDDRRFFFPRNRDDLTQKIKTTTRFFPGKEKEERKRG